MLVDVLIPNYNAAHLLKKYLPEVLKMDGINRVIVVDDASSDNSTSVIKEEFNNISLIALEKNQGFSGAVNTGINESTADYILLLNNDVLVNSGLIKTLMQQFKDESVFAVSPRIILPSKGNLDEGCKYGYWRRGVFFTDQRQGIKYTCPILYTTGCAALYRMSMLKELGGFDTIYSPYYWEDADLGYRAWKRGWKSIYNPDASVIHEHSATISKSNKEKIIRTQIRNSLYFIWRNIDDLEYLQIHRIWLPFIILKKYFSGETAYAKGCIDAIKKRKICSKYRLGDSIYRVLSDEKILDSINSCFE